MEALPEVVPSYGVIGRTDPTVFLGLELPIAGIAGDQQSALFGQTCFAVGDSKCTYGTGSFILVNTGDRAGARPTPGCSRRSAWQHPDGELTYALEGAIFVTGAAVQWLRDGLQIIGTAAETEAIAAIGARLRRGRLRARAHRPRRARLGPARARHDPRHHPGHDARAHRPRHPRGHRLRGPRRAPSHDAGLADRAHGRRRCRRPTTCSASSRPTSLGVPVARPEIVETTGLGAAFLAGLGTGVWDSTEEIATIVHRDARFEPRAGDDRAHRRWRVAVERSKSWAIV